MNRYDKAMTQNQQPVLPLVRLGLILPFVEELERLSIDAGKVLMSNGLVRETVLDPNVFVPVIVIHRFLEDAARAADQPHFGVSVGERLDLAGWPPFVDAVSRASTLGEFLVRFMRSAKEEATSARYSLEVDADYALFREIRTTEQAIAPAQNDGFTAAYLLGILRRGAGAKWDPRQVRVQVCDLEALPDGYLGVDIVCGDRMGVGVRFSTLWLFQSIDRGALIDASGASEQRLHVPVSFLEALGQTLKLHLEDADLTVDRVASRLGLSRQVLQRRLKAAGTTLSEELRVVKKRRAAELLSETDLSVVEIAAAVGFANSTSFTRAFKSWTGEAPRDFRKKRRGGLND